MNSIIKGISKNSILIILTNNLKAKVNRDFLNSLKDGEVYSIQLTNLKDVEKELYAYVKVYDLEKIS